MNYLKLFYLFSFCSLVIVFPILGEMGERGDIIWRPLTRILHSFLGVKIDNAKEKGKIINQLSGSSFFQATEIIIMSKRFSEKEACPKGAQATPELLAAFQGKNVLFYIERNMNTNAVVYEANVVDGKLDEAKPVKVYWIMYNNNPVNEEGLTMIERNSAYGMSTKPVAGKAGRHKLIVTPLKKRNIEVWMDEDGTLHCESTVDGVAAELMSVYVESKSNWVGLPKVQFVELKGKKSADGSKAYEKMKP